MCTFIDYVRYLVGISSVGRPPIVKMYLYSQLSVVSKIAM